MKILHLADLHYRPADAELALASLRTVRETVEREHVDLVAFAGDMFDRAIHNSEQARLPDLLDAWREIMDLCPVVAVSGTITHDVAGCYEPLIGLRAVHGFCMIAPGEALILHGGFISESEELPPDVPGELLILGCPEPSKEWFLADKAALGREESAQAVVDGMGGLLLGLGAIRREHAELPCLMVYHGAVVGASLGNGQTLPPGGIQIGRDDLALVGADYCALGDIHAAQQIGDLPAYYAGSAYPCNWGETDQKGCWLVEIGTSFDAPIRGETVLTRIPFPHRTRAKHVWTLGEPMPDYPSDGTDVWLLVRHRKGEDHAAAEHYLDELLRDGCGLGSRATVEEIATETVRAGEIREASRLRDKVRIWADNSGLEVAQSALAKADQLEEQARAAGVSTEALDVVVNRLVLRGAVGIHKGQGVDEIELDLDQFEDGLIALVAPNGSGKTTLLENLHVFSEMLTRPKTLQAHFCLRDSFRDLYLTDRRTGDRFRTWIQIDAQGACDYHLYRNGEPMVNGRKADYDGAIARLFGSVDMFKRSAYIGRPNGRNPELADLPKGQKKELFAALGGLEPLQFAAAAAGDRAKAIEQQLVGDRREIEILERDTKEAPDYAGQLEKEQRTLARARQLVADVEIEGKDLREQSDAATDRLTAHRKAQVEINERANQVVTLCHERADAETSIKEHAYARDSRPAVEQQLAQYDALKGEEETHHAARTGVLLERERRATEHRHALEAHRVEQRKVESRQRELKDQAAALAREKDRTMAAVDSLAAQLHPIECPHCHKTFALGGETEQVALEEKQQRVLDLDIDLVMNEREQKRAAEEFAALVAPPEPTLPVYDEAPLAGVEAKLARYNVAAIRKALELAATAEARIAASHARISAIEMQIDAIGKQVKSLEAQLDPGAESLAAQLATQLDDVTRRWRDAHGVVEHAKAQAAAIEKQIADINAKLRKLEEKRQAADTAAAEQGEWEVLARAFGPDGIQALELDAMAPELQATVNRLLAVAREAHEGIAFDQVRIDTTRLGGKGSGRHQIEDFLIYCHDTRDDSWTEISMISGGESVWIREALYEAFAVRRSQTSGLRFATVIADEADGALDPEARIAYVRMLEAAHHEAGRRHTIIVTHSEAVQQLIPQRIEMGELARVREGAPA